MTRGRPRPDERGSATIELAIWLPVLFGIVFLTMQGGLLHYGRSAALSIANAGVRAAAVEGGSTAACQQAAARVRAEVGDALTDVTITCQRTATTASATVSGTTMSVIPLVLPTTSQTATLPVERVT